MSSVAADPLTQPPPHPQSDLLDAMNEGLYLVDRRRRITMWNAAAARITGYSAEEVVGRRCGVDLLGHVDESGAVLCGARCPLMATMRDGDHRVANLFLHHKDGHVVPVRVSAGALRSGAEGPIVGAVETFSDDSDAEGVRQRLAVAERRSLTDPLTGLGNRRYLEKVLLGRFAQWQRDARSFGVVILDIDRFKSVNDAHGHEIGDRLLQSVARSLAAAARQSDDVVRYGGEEFVVVTEASGHDELQALGERLRLVVQRSHAAAADGAQIRVTASAGATQVGPDDDAASLLRRSDGLLLEAKRAGRDRILVG